MQTAKPLFWHQGLFLQPQHFQQLEQSADARLTPFREWMAPHFWGVQDMEIKKAALGIRSFGLVKGQFLFPDGTCVSYPGNAVMEDRSFEEDWIEGGKAFPVYIGLRKWNDDGENVTPMKRGDPLSEVSTRFVASVDPEETKDLHAGGPAGHVKKLSHVLKIFWGSEKDHLGDYALIPVAEIEREGTSIVLGSRFIPPCLSVSSSEILATLVKDVEDMLAARGRQLEDHKTQRGIQSAEFGSRDMVYLLALRSLNRSIPMLRHYAETPHLHPWLLYGALRQIIGDLSCFSESVSVTGKDSEEGENGLPEYNPLALWECFSAARRVIARLLNEITAGPDHVVPLAPVDGVYAADLKPSFFDAKNRFYLALTTEEDPQTTLQAIQSLGKLGSRSHVSVLMSHALPGIPLKHLSALPQELPRKSNVLYLEIDAHHDQWALVQKERSVAFAWDGSPDSLKVDLMVVGR
jgi:type VI secretion system protein ImpJ